MWMRGTNDGDTVDVAIGFRDQDGGGEPDAPMQETTETLTLSTSWEGYVVVATAPASPPNPVYSARVSFTAGAGDTVDIDGVAVGAPGRVRKPSLQLNSPDIPRRWISSIQVDLPSRYRVHWLTK